MEQPDHIHSFNVAEFSIKENPMLCNIGEQFSECMLIGPAWAFPVVVIVGMIVSVWIANISMKKRKGIEKPDS